MGVATGRSWRRRHLELRVGGTLRPIYIYDKHRDAVVVCGGDKAGDKGFYKRTIATAEKIWERYLREQE